MLSLAHVAYQANASDLALAKPVGALTVNNVNFGCRIEFMLSSLIFPFLFSEDPELQIIFAYAASRLASLRTASPELSWNSTESPKSA